LVHCSFKEEKKLSNGVVDLKHIKNTKDNIKNHLKTKTYTLKT